MAGLASIFGQDGAVAQLSRAMERGAIHHAYLFEGPDGVGKRATARALAQALNCDAAPNVGCGVCESCRKIDGELHPDVKWFPVLPEKGQTDRVRELLPQLAFAPHEGRRRVVILEPADGLNDTAANVLLKTLEEPPPNSHFVLVTARAASLLVTIRSRCQRVAFRPLTDGQVVAALVARGVEEAPARDAAALGQGSLGRALELATSEDFPRRRAAARRLLEVARARDTGEMLAACGDVATDREEALATIEMMRVCFRDALVLGAGVTDGLDGERLEQAEWLALVPAPGLLVGLRALGEATEAIQGFVGPQLAMEALVLRLAQMGAA